MTLILSKHGRCNERCYNAEHDECDCICAGRNHGKGLKRAAEITRELAALMVKEWRQKHPGAVIEVPVNQTELF